MQQKKPLMNSIMLEGPDGCGKSTLAGRLSKEFNLPVLHFGGPPATPEDYAKKYSSLFDATMSGPHIFDRGPLSEIIYGSLLRDSLICLVDFLLKDLSVLRAFSRTVFVYCRPETEKILLQPIQVRAHKPQDHVEQAKGQRLDIIRAYDFMWPSMVSIWNTYAVKYDWSEESYQKIAKLLKGESE